MYIINDITVLRIFQSACDHPEYDDAQKRQHGKLQTKDRRFRDGLFILGRDQRYQPSIMMVFFSGSFAFSCFGTFRCSTPCSKEALMSSSVRFSPT